MSLTHFLCVGLYATAAKALRFSLSPRNTGDPLCYQCAIRKTYLNSWAQTYAHTSRPSHMHTHLSQCFLELGRGTPLSLSILTWAHRPSREVLCANSLKTSPSAKTWCIRQGEIYSLSFWPRCGFYLLRPWGLKQFKLHAVMLFWNIDKADLIQLYEW